MRKRGQSPGLGVRPPNQCSGGSAYLDVFSSGVKYCISEGVSKAGSCSKLQHTNRKGTTERELFIYLFPLLSLKLTVMMLL
ncbi:hypothetical protein llap_16104 [Limosa lapponica baueri]|uniref:Uncharacterized protein n=1 Tax=Limosa lapponica baueri TaxID=1758121 RepID=A0A2I0TIK8_LIMLA|nr:hypothetical protein llap_16104 [Limosa lapponica baueri]